MIYASISRGRNRLRMMRQISCLLACLFYAAVCFAGDITGTWRLNLQKSPNAKNISSQIVKIERSAPNKYLVTVESISGSGQKGTSTFTRTCDRKEHPVEGSGIPPGTTEICDPITFAVTSKHNGKLSFDTQLRFAPDGKSHTVTFKGPDANGKVVESIYVFERQ